MNADRVQAMGERVLVLADAAESQTKSGLFLASSANSGPGSSVTGSVASVGADVKGVKVGDKVLINGFAGTEVEFEAGVKGKFVNASDVLAVLSS
jgi:chaperonin GroES